MKANRFPPSARQRRQRGSSLLEAAFVILPLMAMVVAIVDFSFLMFLKSTFQFAAREGVRYAITYQTSAGTGHDDSIKQVVQRNSMGFLSGTKASCIKVRYYRPGNLGTEVTGANSNAPGNVIEVAVENFPWSWIVPLQPGLDQQGARRSPLALTAYASDVMQGLPVGALNPPAR